jgi:hypothetical protein
VFDTVGKHEIAIRCTLCVNGQDVAAFFLIFYQNYFFPFSVHRSAHLEWSSTPTPQDNKGKTKERIGRNEKRRERMPDSIHPLKSR